MIITATELFTIHNTFGVLDIIPKSRGCCHFILILLYFQHPCHIHLPVCLWIKDPHSRAAKNTSPGNEVLLQDTTCYQWRSLCQDPAGNRTTRRPPDHRKEAQTKVDWTCLPFIRTVQNNLARHYERGMEKTMQTEKEVGRHDQAMDWSGFAKDSGEKRKMKETVVKSSVVWNLRQVEDAQFNQASCQCQARTA